MITLGRENMVRSLEVKKPRIRFMLPFWVFVFVPISAYEFSLLLSLPLSFFAIVFIVSREKKY